MEKNNTIAVTIIPMEDESNQNTDTKSHNKNMLGIILIVVGALFLFDQFGIIRVGSVISTWWPMIFVIIGSIFLTQKPKNIRTGGIFLLLGLVLQLSHLNLIPLTIWNLWPALLIVIGIYIIINQKNKGQQIQSNDGRLTSRIVFADEQISSASSAFEGGSVLIVFGGATIDLAQVKLKEDTTLSLTVLFGDVSLRLPEKTPANIVVTNVLSDVTNHRAEEPEKKPLTKTLTIQGTVLLGDIDVA
jgi:predicted membrane protein